MGNTWDGCTNVIFQKVCKNKILSEFGDQHTKKTLL